MFRSFLTSCLAQATQRIKYLFRDTFSVDASAPLGSPLACDVIGSWTVVDTENKLSKSGGKLVCAGGRATPGHGDPGMWGGITSRAAGKVFIVGVTLDTSVKTMYSPAWSPYIGGVSLNALKFDSAGALSFYNSSSQQAVIGAYSSGVSYTVALIQRSTGLLYFVKGGNYTAWTLLWVQVEGTENNLYPALSNHSAQFSFDLSSVLQLPAPFNTDYGIATQRLAGARAAGDTFTHEADCLIEWTVTAKPTDAVNQIVRFRMQDAANLWYVLTDKNSGVALIEKVANTNTSRGSAPASITDGQRIVVICDGAVIKVYVNNVLKITYSSATNFQTATAGILYSTGTGGAVSDIVSWPRRLSGTALAVMERYSK